MKCEHCGFDLDEYRALGYSDEQIDLLHREWRVQKQVIEGYVKEAVEKIIREQVFDPVWADIKTGGTHE